MEEFLDVLDSVVSGTEDICAWCRSVNGVIGGSVLNILLDIFHLELLCLCI